MKKSGFENGNKGATGVSSSFLSSGRCIASSGKNTSNNLHLIFILKYMLTCFFSFVSDAEASFTLNLFPDGYSIVKPTEVF